MRKHRGLPVLVVGVAEAWRTLLSFVAPSTTPLRHLRDLLASGGLPHYPLVQSQQRVANLPRGAACFAGRDVADRCLTDAKVSGDVGLRAARFREVRCDLFPVHAAEDRHSDTHRQVMPMCTREIMWAQRVGEREEQEPELDQPAEDRARQAHGMRPASREAGFFARGIGIPIDGAYRNAYPVPIAAIHRLRSVGEPTRPGIAPESKKIPRCLPSQAEAMTRRTPSRRAEAGNSRGAASQANRAM